MRDEAGLVEGVTFAVELDRAMAARGVSVSILAREVGTAHAAIWQWRTLGKLPSVAMADRLAHVLDWDSLLTMVMVARRKRCVRLRVCGAAD